MKADLKYIPNVTAVTLLLSPPWRVAQAGCHTGDVQALVARCSQAGLCLGAFLTSACLLPQLSPGRAHSLGYAQDFFTGWLEALFPQSQRSAVSRAYNTCAKSQVSKWNKCKLHEQLRVQLCSCRVETVPFQFKYGYGKKQRH